MTIYVHITSNIVQNDLSVVQSKVHHFVPSLSYIPFQMKQCCSNKYVNTTGLEVLIQTMAYIRTHACNTELTLASTFVLYHCLCASTAHHIAAPNKLAVARISSGCLHSDKLTTAAEVFTSRIVSTKIACHVGAWDTVPVQSVVGLLGAVVHGGLQIDHLCAGWGHRVLH